MQQMIGSNQSMNSSNSSSEYLIKSVFIDIGRTGILTVNNTESNYIDSQPSVRFIPCCWYLLALFGLLIILMNSIVIFIYRRNHMLQKKTFMMLLYNQACADFLTGMLYVPAYIIDDHIPFNISSYIVCFIFFNGLFSRALLAFNCYISITMPLQYNSLLTKTRFKYSLVATWGASLLLSLLPLSWITDTSYNKQMHRRIFRIFLWIVIATLLFSILIFYLTTFYKARRFIRKKLAVIKKQNKSCMKRLSRLSNTYSRKEYRLTIQFAIATCIFIITYLPLLYINLIEPFFQRSDLNPQVLLTMSLYMFLLNSIISPLISLCFNKDFRAPVMDRFRAAAVNIRKKNNLVAD